MANDKILKVKLGKEVHPLVVMSTQFERVAESFLHLAQAEVKSRPISVEVALNDLLGELNILMGIGKIYLAFEKTRGEIINGRNSRNDSRGRSL